MSHRRLPLFEALETRRTAHSFHTDEVPLSCIETAVEMANWAPCHRFTWPWRFSVVGPQTRSTLLQIAAGLTAKKRGCSKADALAVVSKKLGSSGAMVIARQVLSPDPFTQDEDHASCAIAIHNFTLALHAQGWASKWSTSAASRQPATYELFGLNPSSERILGLILIGKPKAILSPRARPTVDELLDRLP